MASSEASVLAGVVVVLPLVALWAYCLVDFTRTDEQRMRTFTKPMWMVVLVFFNVVGGVMWLQLGRPQRPARHP
ncbi:PLD nuclease N-terminal domain-containing protein [Cellulomonas sp. WB94]|uniref:PLD nuclease N-terminal domain-containing protein n=1 Tax=Cellulomonas sp. WB94 TaxID=2173174 RepID=UPI001304A21A|nr:PLD nuclease N-terminal domain-containing protein [Cellulomonas sp. WB94]